MKAGPRRTVLIALPTLLFVGLVGLTLGIGFVAAFTLVQVNALFLVWLERKVSAHIQLRIGPKEVGPFGVLQTLVDGIKLVGKELIAARQASLFLFLLSPVIVFTPVMVPFVVIPFGENLLVRDSMFGPIVSECAVIPRFYPHPPVPSLNSPLFQSGGSRRTPNALPFPTANR